MANQPTGVEARFDPRDILVSKTDVHGIITYANRHFIDISGYTEDELLGAPHSLVRHPSMPRCVFDLLWETLRDGREIFAFVVNLAKDGRHYWVFAHVTPDVSPVSGEVIGYHSSRRQAVATSVRVMEDLYAELLRVESRATTKREACRLGREALERALAEKGVTYERFVMDIYALGNPAARAA